MESIKTIGIKDLKNNLSSYIQEVKRGIRLLITDRQQVVAELREPLEPRILLTKAQALKEQWIQEGKLIPAAATKKKLPKSIVSLPEGTALSSLNEDRGE